MSEVAGGTPAEGRAMTRTEAAVAAVGCGILSEIAFELSTMIRDGLLELSVNIDGDALYWPTELGMRVLGMIT